MLNINEVQLHDKLDLIQRQVQKVIYLFDLIDHKTDSVYIEEDLPMFLGMLYDDAVEDLCQVSSELKDLNATIMLRSQEPRRSVARNSALHDNTVTYQ